MAEEQVEITPFDKLFSVPIMVNRLAETRGLAWILANKGYRKYQPCLIAAVYYRMKPVEYIRPEFMVMREDGSLGMADFGDFVVTYNEETEKYEYIIKDFDAVEKKYGKEFTRFLSSIVSMLNEDGICRVLVSALDMYEAEKADITFDGIRALFTVAALKVASLRARPAKLPVEIRPSRRIRAEKVTRRVEVEEIPELDSIANLVRYVANKYKISIDEVLDLLSRYLS